jgi:DNA-binding MarR family transcriptional regulator
MSDALLRRSGLDRQLGFALRLAYTSVWADLVATLEPHGLKPQTLATLMLIDAGPGCKQQDVADALGIQRPNIVAMIDSLVETGWIDRQTSPTDRRSYALSLTPEGRTKLEQAMRAHAEHDARTTALLGARARDGLVNASLKLGRTGRRD